MELVAETDYRISCPTVDPENENLIYAICKQSGCIVSIDGSKSINDGNNLNVKLFAETNGQPSGIAIDIFNNSTAEEIVGRENSKRISFVLADPSMQNISLLTVDKETGANSDDNNPSTPTISELLKSYLGKPFRGPIAIAIDNFVTNDDDNATRRVVKEGKDQGVNDVTDLKSSGSDNDKNNNINNTGNVGEITFTDGGFFSDCFCSSSSSSTLFSPCGSLFRTINNRRRLIKVIPSSSLSYPSAIAVTTAGLTNAKGANTDTVNGSVIVDKDNVIIYVAEMPANRILRVISLPTEGGFYTSVFAQLYGGMGPVALAVHPVSKEVYVGIYELNLNNAASVNSGSVHVFYPTGELKGTITVPSSQISGIAFDNNGRTLYITIDGGMAGICPSTGKRICSQLYRYPISN